jgi:hypothetical protein
VFQKLADYLRIPEHGRKVERNKAISASLPSDRVKLRQVHRRQKLSRSSSATMLISRLVAPGPSALNALNRRALTVASQPSPSNSAMAWARVLLLLAGQERANRRDIAHPSLLGKDR